MFGFMFKIRCINLKINLKINEFNFINYKRKNLNAFTNFILSQKFI